MPKIDDPIYPRLPAQPTDELVVIRPLAGGGYQDVRIPIATLINVLAQQIDGSPGLQVQLVDGRLKLNLLAPAPPAPAPPAPVPAPPAPVPAPPAPVPAPPAPVPPPPAPVPPPPAAANAVTFDGQPVTFDGQPVTFGA